jgi:hypothetical protein
MTELVLMSCCQAATGTFTEAVGADPVFANGDVIGPAPARDDERRRLDAWHESGHALVGVVFGIVGHASVKAANPLCRAIVPEKHDAVLKVAGHIAERLARRLVWPQSDDAIRAAVARVRAGGIGRCDECRAARACIATAGDDDEAALATYREAEALATKIIDSEPGRRFLRIAAHELLKRGEVQGAFFHDLAKEILPTNFIDTLK